MICQSCQRTEVTRPVAAVVIADWQLTAAGAVYLCQLCQMDANSGGGFGGVGWQWLQAELQKRGAMPEVTITFTKDKTGGGVTRFEAVRSDKPSIYLTIEQSYPRGLWQVYRKLVDGTDTYDVGLSREEAMQLAEGLLRRVIEQEPGGKLIMGDRVNEPAA